jgi:hypothetical protein
MIGQPSDLMSNDLSKGIVNIPHWQLPVLDPESSKPLDGFGLMSGCTTVLDPAELMTMSTGAKSEELDEPHMEEMRSTNHWRVQYTTTLLPDLSEI